MPFLFFRPGTHGSSDVCSPRMTRRTDEVSNNAQVIAHTYTGTPEVPPQNLGYQLTLFEPRGADYARLITTCHFQKKSYFFSKMNKRSPVVYSGLYSMYL